MDQVRTNIGAALRTKEVIIALISLAAIVLHLALRFGIEPARMPLGFKPHVLPLLFALSCGTPLILKIIIKLVSLDITSDLLAGISIVAAVLLGEYLAGTIVVLMLASGQALEAYAVRRASFALEALAKRLPSVAHRKKEADVIDVALAEVTVGDKLIVFPHESNRT